LLKKQILFLKISHALDTARGKKTEHSFFLGGGLLAAEIGFDGSLQAADRGVGGCLLAAEMW